MDVLLTDKEKEILLNTGAIVYGIDRLEDNADMAIEEQAAEDFRRYVQRSQIPLIGRVLSMFRTLKHIIQTWLGNTQSLNYLFYRINNGELAQRALRNDDTGLSYSFENLQDKVREILWNELYHKNPNAE